MRDTSLVFPLPPQLKWSELYEDADSPLDEGLKLLSCCERSLVDQKPTRCFCVVDAL